MGLYIGENEIQRLHVNKHLIRKRTYVGDNGYSTEEESGGSGDSLVLAIGDVLEDKVMVAGFITFQNQEYAYCILDSELWVYYGTVWASSNTSTGLTNQNATGTYNMSQLKSKYNNNLNNYPAFKYCDDLEAVEIDGISYKPVLPSYAEGIGMYENIDGFSSGWQGMWTSTEDTVSNAYAIRNGGTVASNQKNYSMNGITPIIEIPVNSNHEVVTL